MMKLIYLTISTFFLLALTSCIDDYSKQDALTQSHICLKIKNDLGNLSQERKIYYFLIAENIENEIKVNDSTIKTIRLISDEIQEKNATYKEKLIKLRLEHKDSRFLDATIDFIETNQNLESKADLLVKSVLDSMSDKDIEKKLADNLKVIVQKMTEFKSEYIIRESEFHNENNISQTEVDSIVNILER